MPEFYPTYDKIKELKVKPEEGELYLLNFFRNSLPDDFEVYFQTFMNGDRPDIILMRKNHGVMIIEVKDWDLKNYYLDERRKWRLKKNNAYLKSPIDQVLQYKENIFNLHIENLLEKKIKDFKYWLVVSCAVYFHKATEQTINNFLIEPYKENRRYMDFLKYNIDLLGYDNVNKIDFERILRKRYLKSNFHSRYFNDVLYDSFKRYFKPPLHTIDEGKLIKYNKVQQRLIVSEEREQRINPYYSRKIW